MKISCTKKEKDNMKRILLRSDFCLFDGIETEYRCEPDYCSTCYEEHIEWDVKEGDRE